MKTEKLIVDGEEFNVTEFLATSIDEIDFTDKKEANKKQVILATGITEQRYALLTFKERSEIFKVINRINGLSQDFTIPTK